MESSYIVRGIVQKGDCIVLGRKAKGRPPHPDAWHLPGGGVEDAEKAAKLFRRGDYDNAYFHEEVQREIRAKLSIEVKNIRCLAPQYLDEPLEDEMPDEKGELTHYYSLQYICDYAGGELKAGDGLAGGKWIKRADLYKYALAPPDQAALRALGWLVYKNPDGTVTSPLDNLALWPFMGTIAWQTAGPLLILGIGGALLDRRAHTTPLLLLLGVAASVGVSYVLVRGTVRRLQRQIDARTRHKES